MRGLLRILWEKLRDVVGALHGTEPLLLYWNVAIRVKLKIEESTDAAYAN